jgi:hypothetical protein
MGLIFINCDDSRDEEISWLKTKLAEKAIAPKYIEKAKRQLYMLQKGLQGEKEVEYILRHTFSDRWVCINNLSLFLEDGRQSQIDHVVINPLKEVYLIETKNFTNDIKVDADGRFSYMDKKTRDWKAFPSPLAQTERHEGVFRTVLDDAGIQMDAFYHYVVVGFGANLSKPKKGFENVCRAEDLKKRFVDQKMGVVNLMKGVGTLVKSTVSPLSFEEEARLFAQELEAMVNKHQKTTVKDLSFMLKPQPKIERAEPESARSIEWLTMSKLLRELKLPKEAFIQKLSDLGYIQMQNNGFVEPTAAGKAFGIRLNKNKYGWYCLYPVKETAEVFK